jgi:hypothetical protein
MASLLTAMQKYMSGQNQTVGAASIMTAVAGSPMQSGNMRRAAGPLASPISQATVTLRNIVRSIRGINEEDDKQRSIIGRMRRAADEDRREAGEPDRIKPEVQDTTEPQERGGGGLGGLLGIIAGAITVVSTMLRMIMRVIGMIRGVFSLALRPLGRLTTALLSGISMIMRNPRLRILATAATAAAASITAMRTFSGGETTEGPITGGSERVSGGPLPEGFGSLAARYESRGNPGAIGFDTTGGWSYGSSQIATRTGTMSRFLQYLQLKHPDAAATLMAAGGNEGATAGTEQFKQAWRNLASSDQKFNQTQKDFITDTHYIPLSQKVLRETGVDVSQRSRALQEVVNSTAIQHGAATNIITRAIQAAGGPGASDESIIQKVYDERSDPSRFRSSTPQVQASVQRRFVSERQDALRMLNAERQTASPSMAANAPQTATTPEASPAPASPQASPPPPVTAAAAQTAASLPTANQEPTMAIQPIIITVTETSQDG